MQNPVPEQFQTTVAPYEKPTAHIGLRLPPSIASHWKAAANSQQKSLSDWLRAQIHDLEIKMEETKKKPRGKREIIRTYQEVDPVLIRELGRIGNNLNQIARQANRAAFMGQAIQVTSFLLVLVDMQEELRLVLHTVGSKYSTKQSFTQTEESVNAH